MHRVATTHGRADGLCGRIAHSQHGLITHRQGLAAGLSDTSIQYRVDRGRWRRVLPGVYCIAGAPSSVAQDLCAAQLWSGEGSAVSHGAAAHLWGFDGFDSPTPEVSTVRPIRPNGLPIVVHRVDDILLGEIVSGTPAVTSVRRTLLDLAGVGHRRMEAGLDKAIRERLTSLGQIWLMLDEPRLWGRRGVRRLRRALEVRTPDAGIVDSELERLALRVLDRGGLPQPDLHFPIRLPSGITIHVDLAYPDAKLAIECDGYAWHMDRQAFERDRNRDLELMELGWKCIRITWAMLKFEPTKVIAAVKDRSNR